MSVIENVDEIIGQPLLDPEIKRIGKIENIIVDSETGEPEWVAVNTGLFRSHTHLVPLRNAAFDANDVRIPYIADKVKASPEFDSMELSAEDQEALYDYYKSA